MMNNMKKNGKKVRKLRLGIIIDPLIDFERKFKKKTKKKDEAVSAVFGTVLMLGLTSMVATGGMYLGRDLMHQGLDEIKAIGIEFIYEMNGIVGNMEDIRDDAYHGYQRNDDEYAYFSDNNPYMLYDSVNGTIMFRMPAVDVNLTSPSPKTNNSGSHGIEFIIDINEFSSGNVTTHFMPDNE
jgi:hypothetical protein